MSVQLVLLVLFSQGTLWRHVPAGPGHMFRGKARITSVQKRSVERLIVKSNPDASCLEFDKLYYSAVDLAVGISTILVEAGPGCMRGGQGSNGAMWLVRFDDGRPALVSPKEFEGWLYTIQPSKSHDYRDIVLGWHNSAAETGLQYFKFNGTVYRPVGLALLTYDPATDSRRIFPGRH